MSINDHRGPMGRPEIYECINFRFRFSWTDIARFRNEHRILRERCVRMGMRSMFVSNRSIRPRMWTANVLVHAMIRRSDLGSTTPTNYAPLESLEAGISLRGVHEFRKSKTVNRILPTCGTRGTLPHSSLRVEAYQTPRGAFGRVVKIGRSLNHIKGRVVCHHRQSKPYITFGSTAIR